MGSSKVVSSFLVILLVLFGFGVAIVSLYQLSLVGVYSKMGLTNADYTNVIDREEFMILMDSFPTDDISCDLLSYFRGTLDYMSSEGEERGMRSVVLGERRVVCGARAISKGRVRWGAYMVVKGVRYLEEGTSILDESFCLQESSTVLVPRFLRASWYISAFLESSRGELRESVRKPYSVLAMNWRSYPCIDE